MTYSNHMFLLQCYYGQSKKKEEDYTNLFLEKKKWDHTNNP